jgi:hypothetical protein
VLAERYFLKIRGSVLPTLSLSALYNMDQARCEALRGVHRRMAAGVAVSPQELVALQLEALRFRRVLEEHVQAVLRAKSLHLYGPRLAGLEDALAAVQEVAPNDFPRFAMTVRNTLQVRQRSDGHFISGISNDDSLENRGDNTFGTSTTVMTLMYLDAREGKIIGGATAR